jgi:hypothetical protein
MEIKEELLDIEGIKNSNKSMLDLFIRRTSVITSTPEDLVEKIIKDQWKRANQVLSTGTSIGEVDFPNLGSFKLSKKKSKARIEKLEKFQVYNRANVNNNPKLKPAIEERIVNNDRIISDIKRKIKVYEN